MTLADPRRLEILRFLMASPVTLTRAAKDLTWTAACIRYHILALDVEFPDQMTGVHKTAKVTYKR